uniref:uncharacterized protein LOC122605449 n=1 Tax=Erigeron canadensis TaxID=72917 RepID=UPI001CB99DB7|nr:uncharacterized protein LOC122605449 [Erigeron canadensis]
MERNVITKIDTTTIDNYYDNDRISDLPDFIAHHILSFLVDSPKELIRTSVLSKKWLALTASFPILHFNLESFDKAIYPSWAPFDRQYSKKIFFKYIAYTISRFSQHQNVINANTFDLRAELEDPAHADIMNRCLGFVLKPGLQVFAIYSCGRHRYSVPPPMYRLPNVLLSVSSLTSLSIRDCELPSLLIAGDGDVVRFKLLKMLNLDDVYLNEEMIKCLTAGCPLLEEFRVCRCYGFKRLCVYGLQNLQKVEVYYTSEVEEIDIQAPNLSDIFLSDMNAKGVPPCINLFSGKTLSMIFYGCFSEQFAVSLSNFPFLETLILKLSYDHTILKLSSHSLRTLSLDTQIDLEDIEIDTPNLLYFQYSSRCSNVHRPIRNSGESKACMECYPDLDCDTIWFQQFRRFLDKTIAFKVLKLHICTNNTDVEELKLLEWPPFELEHIELNVRGISELSEYLPVLEAVLWCCRPRSLTLKSFNFYNDIERRNQVVKFTYEKLLQQEDKGKTNIQIMFSTVKACGSHDLLITFLKEEVNHKASLEARYE